VSVVWSGLLIAAAFLAGRVSHDPPAPSDQTVIGSLSLLVDEGLLSRAECDEIWREYVEKVRAG
jgi:hypothetical protein